MERSIFTPFKVDNTTAHLIHERIKENIARHEDFLLPQESVQKLEHSPDGVALDPALLGHGQLDVRGRVSDLFHEVH